MDLVLGAQPPTSAARRPASAASRAVSRQHRLAPRLPCASQAFLLSRIVAGLPGSTVQYLDVAPLPEGSSAVFTFRRSGAATIAGVVALPALGARGCDRLLRPRHHAHGVGLLGAARTSTTCTSASAAWRAATSCSPWAPPRPRGILSLRARWTAQAALAQEGRVRRGTLISAAAAHGHRRAPRPSAAVARGRAAGRLQLLPIFAPLRSKVMSEMRWPTFAVTSSV